MNIMPFFNPRATTNSQASLSSVMSLLHKMNAKIDTMARKVDAIEKVIVTSPNAQGKRYSLYYFKYVDLQFMLNAIYFRLSLFIEGRRIDIIGKI